MYNVNPAQSYVEQRLTIDSMCGIDGNCRVIETSCGWAVINVAINASSGDTLLVTMGGRNQFVKLQGAALITEEGEAIEGDYLDDVKVHGVLTHTLNMVSTDRLPVI